MAPRFHRFFPTLPQCFGLLLLLVLTSAAWRTAMVASDGDSLMHCRVGDWMLEHRQIIAHDEFSHTRNGAPVITKEWLAELIFAGAGHAGGLYGLVFVAALAIAATFALLLRQLLREGHDLLAASGVVVMATWAACGHWMARPHVFSFLLLVLWNGALLRYERDRQAGRIMAGLGTLTVLWVNLHGGFLAGFLVLGAYWLGAVLERDWAKLRVLTWTGLLCAVASLLNPSGFRLHLNNVAFLRSQFLTDWLAEYASTDFHSRGALGFLGWLALIFFTLVIVRPKLSASAGVLLLSWLYFALYSVRNVPLLTLVSAPILAGALTPVVPARWRELSQRVQAVGGDWLLVTVIVIAVAVTPHPITLPADHWPVEAVAYIRQHPQQFTGKMFNQYMWGGYLLKELPEHKTFVDGRTDFFGEELIREFADTTALKPGWTNTFAKYDVSWVLMPQPHRLNLALAKMPGWTNHSDAVATVWWRTP